MPDFEVRRDDLRATRVVGGEAPAAGVADGEVQLRVERFGLTANNVTYGVLGDALRYWRFYPASEDGWGRVPVWGLGEVVASGVEGVAPGELLYGFLPMSTLVTLRLEAGAGGLAEVSEHRRELPGVYNRYLPTPPDAERLDETLLLRPLFGTSFLLAAHLRERGHFGADAVVVASASSKTAYGLAFLLAAEEGAPRLVGLTSERNRAFVASLGVYDEVLAYEQAGELGDRSDALVLVDMAGDASVRSAVHHAASERLRSSITVGVTHWEQMGDPSGLPGPAPELFFAPDHVERLTAELGPAELQRRLGEAWDGFAAQLGDRLEVEHGEGPEDLERVWRAAVDGAADPRRGHVLRLPG